MAETHSGRTLRIGLGLGLIALALALPTAWYDRLAKPREALPDPPIKGVTLLRLCLGLEGLAFLLLGASVRARLAVGPDDRLRLPEPETIPGGDLRRPWAWVAPATLLAAALRLYNIGSDLWIDEITPIFDYRDFSYLEIATTYVSSNNHLLNTLAVQAMARTFGMSEWAVRLPAVLLGVACIPAQYLLARVALGRRESVLAAILLAVSYHHILFSQNARGYSGLLFWSLLGTASFLRALATDRPRWWALYVLTMLLATATVLYGFFVIAGHGLALLGACAAVRLQGGPALPLLRKGVAMLAVLGMSCFTLYACIVPQVYLYVGKVYKSRAVGYSPFSLEHLEELRRGLAAGFGAGATAGALVAVVVVGIGFIAFARRHAVYCLTLIAPVLVTAAFLLARGLRFSPRFFLWALPVSFIFAVGTVTALARALGRGRPSDRPRPIATLLPLALAGGVVAMSLVSLPRYYRTPKQPTRASLDWVLARKQPDDLVVTSYLAEWGVRVYGPAVGLEEGKSFLAARSLDDLTSIERRHPGRGIWLLMTFPRALRLELPDLDRHIAANYEALATFPASIGDGEIIIWKQRSSGQAPDHPEPPASGPT